MSGTLNFTFPAGRLLRFSSSDCFLSSSSVNFQRRPRLESAKQCRASINAFTTETDSVLIDSRRPSSLYEVLRVNRNASPMEIKSAYRSLAKLYHPDSALHRSEPDGRDFIEIHNAYATLSDPSARALYDLSSMTVHRIRRPFSYAAQNGHPGFYPTRRWETDQCW